MIYGPVSKNHIDFASDIDLLVRHDSQFSSLGKHFGDLIGAGLQLFSIGGGIVRKVLFDIISDFHRKRGYRIVETPIIASAELYKTSGHLKFYRENMYVFKIEDKEFVIKPMNCPHHMLIFANLLQKYRNRVPLPFRIFELGRVHRYEPSGSLYGLLRVRGFTQDDAHIFVEPKDIKKEMLKVFDELREIYSLLFNLPVNEESIKLRLSFYDPSELGKYYAGTKEEWEEVQEFMRKVAEEINEKYGIEYFEGKGEAVFYGPKLDVVANLEGVGEWQIGTIQFDFNLPRKFRLVELIKEVYGADKQVYTVHRALLGSIERFLGVYLEYKKGRLPFVLHPIQMVIIGIQSGNKDIDEKVVEKVRKIKEILVKEEIRAGVHIVSKVNIAGYIRKLESSIKPPIYIFIGEKEIKEGFIGVRYLKRGKKIEKRIKEYNEMLDIIEELEEGVVKMNGKKYRLYEDLEYML